MIENEDQFYVEGIQPEEIRRPLWWRVTVVVITLLLIFAILATTILPGIIAASRRAEMQSRPTPTLLPSA